MERISRNGRAKSCGANLKNPDIGFPFSIKEEKTSFVGISLEILGVSEETGSLDETFGFSPQENKKGKRSNDKYFLDFGIIILQ